MMTSTDNAPAIEGVSQPVPKWRSFLLSPAFGSLLFFVVIWRLDFPSPHVDDLFHIGAGINLASGGDYSNPLLVRQEQDFGTRYFFSYPPVHSFLLALWLKVFGITAWSMAGFFCAAMWISSASAAVVLKRNGAPVLFSWLVPLGFTFALMPIGMRPEISSIALALAGFALAGAGARSIGRMFFGYLLIFLGGACAPRITVFAAALVVCAMIEFWRKNRGDTSAVRRMVLVIFLALLLTLVIFAAMIDFRIMEFWKTFHFHSSRVSGKSVEQIKDFVRHELGILQWPWILLPIGMALYYLRKKKDELTITGTILVAAFFVTIFIGGLGKGSLWWMSLSTVFLVAALTKSTSARSVVIQAVFAAMLLFANRKVLANVYGLASGNIVLHEDDNRNRELRTLQSTPEHPLLVDAAAARYVFDYRMPQNAVDLGFAAPFPGGIPGELSADELRPNDVFMTGSATSSILVSRTYLQLTIPKWSFFGRFQFDVFPRRVYVISAADIKGPRPREEIPLWVPKSHTKQ